MTMFNFTQLMGQAVISNPSITQRLSTWLLFFFLKAAGQPVNDAF